MENLPATTPTELPHGPPTASAGVRPDGCGAQASPPVSEFRTASPPTVAILIPCYNEALTIADVVRDFRAALPRAVIHVFDNNSDDGTTTIAQSGGAHVQAVSRQGKGHVVRRMFADIDADYYVLVDGDGTYDANSAPAMLQLAADCRFDMVVGVRHSGVAGAYRRGHAIGNNLLTGFLGWLFGRPCRDVLSGFRVFSRRFVKSFPVLSGGFEIETEITVHALELQAPVGEWITPYRCRPPGSSSKLNTYADGTRILVTMLRLFSAERPLTFFSLVAAALGALAVILAAPLLATYLDTGLVPRFPTAILATGLSGCAALSFFAGLILDTVTRGRREIKLLAYLRERAPR